MTTVAYASSVRPNVNVMLLKVPDHSSKEEEMLTPRLVSVRRIPRSHVAILSMKERLFRQHCYPLRRQRSLQRSKIDSGKRSLARGIHWAEIEDRSDRLSNRQMIHVPLGATTQR